MHTVKITNSKTVSEIIMTTIPHDQTVVVWVSWWPDSMYLLYQLKTFWKEKKYDPKNLHIISCNHQTRNNLHQEMKSVKGYCIEHQRTEKTYTGKEKTEQALRQRRHQVFIDYCHQHNSSSLLLWHHLDDRIETTLLNIIRWCGTQGIQAFWVREAHFLDPQITIIRPLIEMQKKEILTECKNKSIPYHVDPTNTDEKVSQRNMMRRFLEECGKKDAIVRSIQKLYHTLDTIETPPIIIESNTLLPLANWMHLINICAGEWTDTLLYNLFWYYTITINPRSETLKKLSQQLMKSWNSIQYQGLLITSYKYWSTIQEIKKI